MDLSSIYHRCSPQLDRAGENGGERLVDRPGRESRMCGGQGGRARDGGFYGRVGSGRNFDGLGFAGRLGFRV